MMSIAGCSGGSNNTDSDGRTDDDSSSTTQNTVQSTSTPETSSESTPGDAEPDTFETVWTNTSRSQWSPVTVHDGTVYVVGWGEDSTAVLFALNPASGDQQWSTETQVEALPFFAVTEDSIIVGDTVRSQSDGSVRWQGAGNSETDFRPQLAVDGAVYTTVYPLEQEARFARYDLQSGREEWRAADDLAGRYVASSVGVHNLRQPQSAQWELVSREHTSGDSQWVQPLSASNPGLIGAAEGVVVGFDAGSEPARPPYRLLGIDADSGNSLWEQSIETFRVWPYNRNDNRSHAFTDTSVIFPTTERVDSSGSDGPQTNFFVRSHSLADGSLRWKQKIPQAETRYDDFVLSMTTTSESVYFGRSVANGSLSTKGFELARTDGTITAEGDIQIWSVTDGRLLGWVPGSGQYGLSLAMAERSN